MADLTIGIVGLGSIGQRHIKNILSLCAEKGLSHTVVALRHKPSALPSALASLVDREAYSYADMPCCDIVLICNPSQVHLETVHKLKNKAAKIFLEKPAFIKPVSEAELSELDPSGDKIRIACPLRHSRTYEALSAFVKANDVYSARAICSSYLPQWRPMADYSKLYSAREDSGGVKIDLIHEFDYMFRLLASQARLYCWREGSPIFRSGALMLHCIQAFIPKWPSRYIWTTLAASLNAGAKCIQRMKSGHLIFLLRRKMLICGMLEKWQISLILR